MRTFLIITASIQVFSLIFLIIPTEVELSRLATEGASLIPTLQLATSKTANIAALRADYERAEQRLMDVLTECPCGIDTTDEVIAMLTDVGTRSGLTAMAVTPGPTSFERAFRREHFGLRARGNFHEVAMFLNELSRRRLTIIVDPMHLAFEGEQDLSRQEKVVVNAALGLTIFRWR